MAVEHFWYVYKEHRDSSCGIRLLKEFMKWAEDVGAKRISMVHLAYLNADKLDSIYKKLGFEPMEVHYVKRLGE